MREYIDIVESVRLKAKQYANDYQGLDKDDPRNACFRQIHNIILLSVDLLQFYDNAWSTTSAKDPVEIERRKEMNHNKCDDDNKHMFVFVMSSIEYNIKRIIQSQPSHPLNECIGKRNKLIEQFESVYLELDENSQEQCREFRKELKSIPPIDTFRRIIDKSTSQELLSTEDKNLWIFLMEVRNISVHNDLYAIRDMDIKIEGREFRLVRGKRPYDRLDFYPVLASKAIDLFVLWVRHFDDN